MLVVVLLLAAQLASRLRAQNARATQCAAGILGACGSDDAAADFGLPAPVAVATTEPCDATWPDAEAPASSRARPAVTSTRVQLPRTSDESQGRGSPASADARAAKMHTTTTPSTPVALPCAMSTDPPIEVDTRWASTGLRPDDATARPLAVNLTTFLETSVYSVVVLDRSRWTDHLDM
ncbi:hypothetical protein AURDEDRAFT_179718 [Auricularia subglabra TFB-10046 SS5]|nr:hypothetical protein AURDEDRAFT_179718 [Auricularia subglabra TFB-10046 SS5]